MQCNFDKIENYFVKIVLRVMCLPLLWIPFNLGEFSNSYLKKISTSQLFRFLLLVVITITNKTSTRQF